jgi:hypothetical protein
MAAGIIGLQPARDARGFTVQPTAIATTTIVEPTVTTSQGKRHGLRLASDIGGTLCSGRWPPPRNLERRTPDTRPVDALTGKVARAVVADQARHPGLTAVAALERICDLVLAAIDDDSNPDRRAQKKSPLA